MHAIGAGSLIHIKPASLNVEPFDVAQCADAATHDDLRVKEWEGCMTASIPGPQASFISRTIARWRRNWARARSNLFDLQDCSAEERDRIARSLGISSAELRLIASGSPDRLDLLRRRMMALRLEPDGIARAEPATFAELHRLCTGCESRGRCALDLTDQSIDPASGDWREYCPNARTLSVLCTLKACSQTVAAPFSPVANRTGSESSDGSSGHDETDPG